MSKWRVYNKHINGLTHKEKFKDQIIEIAAGAYVVMDYEDAVQFKGQYFPIYKDAQGVQDPKSYKMIHIEPDSPEVTAVAEAIVKYVSHIDGKEFATKEALEKHLTEFYADSPLIVKDENLDKELAKTKRK